MFTTLVRSISPVYGSFKIFKTFYLDKFIALYLCDSFFFFTSKNRFIQNCNPGHASYSRSKGMSHLCDSFRGFWATTLPPSPLHPHGIGLNSYPPQLTRFWYYTLIFKRLYLLVIGSPYATCDLTFQVDLRWPMSLPTDRADQDKPISIWNKRLCSIVAPCEITHLWDTHREKEPIISLTGKVTYPWSHRAGSDRAKDDPGLYGSSIPAFSCSSMASRFQWVMDSPSVTLGHLSK